MNIETRDVVILGGGLAGLSLARQLLLQTDKNVLLLERRIELPPARQKVGESLVQVGGYYFSKVLDLEEHLLCEHLMKYNLRFFHRSQGDNRSYEDYGQSYIRHFSNVASYQLDRNKLEAELSRLNEGSPRFDCITGVSGLDVSIQDPGPHRVSFQHAGSTRGTACEWVVDTTGRTRFLAERMGVSKDNAISHGASFLWVDGLLNVEKLTDLTGSRNRLMKERASLGHLPVWLATNHFMGNGFWVWVIPLQGKTSIGLVFDRNVVSGDDVSTPDRLVHWICREFPLFERDLPARKIISHGYYKDFSYDCRQTLSASKWAMAGESGRFSDPLYSPGSDLIAFHNTLIVSAIGTQRREALGAQCAIYESLLHALYEAYVPAFSVGYAFLGDQECFALKYTWELSVYFTFYVFPFVNDLFVDTDFVPAYLGRFAALAAWNRNLQSFLRDYAEWKRTQGVERGQPRFHDFTSVGSLRDAESTFYRVGVGPEEARTILDEQLDNLQQLARFIVGHVSARVLDEPSALRNRDFVEGIDLKGLRFSIEDMKARLDSASACSEVYPWTFDPTAMGHLQDPSRPVPAKAEPVNEP